MYILYCALHDSHRTKNLYIGHLLTTALVSINSFLVKDSERWQMTKYSMEIVI